LTNNPKQINTNFFISLFLPLHWLFTYTYITRVIVPFILSSKTCPFPLTTSSNAPKFTHSSRKFTIVNYKTRHDANRSQVFEMRSAHGPRIRRRPETDEEEILHQLGLHRVHPSGKKLKILRVYLFFTRVCVCLIGVVQKR
jgi:hypothetical protein